MPPHIITSAKFGDRQTKRLEHIAIPLLQSTSVGSVIFFQPHLQHSMQLQQSIHHVYKQRNLFIPPPPVSSLIVNRSGQFLARCCSRNCINKAAYN